MTLSVTITLILLIITLLIVSCDGFTDDELVSLRDEVKEAFLFAYDSYIQYGVPYDEVLPMSCQGRSYKHRIRGTLDDSLGNYYLTLIDSLDSLVLLNEQKRFVTAIFYLKSKLTFNTDIDVSTFETNIRVLGGLLSAHQLSLVLMNNPANNFTYDGFLLDFAKDLGDRLLPAFNTPSGIPYHRINLIHGLRKNETSLTCPAAGGTYLMELGLLSRLLKNSKYENAAFKATKSIFDRRSSIDLIGSLIDVNTGTWHYTHSGIGAGFDSFFEYLIKGYSLLGDIRLLKMFDITYNAIEKHVNFNNNTYIEVDMVEGRKKPVNLLLSSLSAFWPALQVIAGKISSARKSFEVFRHYYKKFSVGLPDLYDIGSDSLLEYGRGNINRPEMIESSYMLYTATKDEKYLSFAKEFLVNVQSTRAPCGYSGYSDVLLKTIDDRMDSFVIAETLKYLYLIFDEGIKSHSKRRSFFCNTNTTSESCISKASTIFTTEGHLFIIDKSSRRNGINRMNNHLSVQTCAAI